MARHVLDYNPQTGETVSFDYSEAEGIPKAVITHSQDVSGILKQAAEWRSKTDTKTDFGIKNDLWHYARIPYIIIQKMKFEDGVDFYSEADEAKVLHLINTKYANFKTTHKNHGVSADRKYYIANIKDV